MSSDTADLKRRLASLRALEAQAARRFSRWASLELAAFKARLDLITAGQDVQPLLQ